jgi:hypothetical protein
MYILPRADRDLSEKDVSKVYFVVIFTQDAYAM